MQGRQFHPNSYMKFSLNFPLRPDYKCLNQLEKEKENHNHKTKNKKAIKAK